jgi:hypothetical protein
VVLGFVLSLQHLDKVIVCGVSDEAPHRLDKIDVNHLQKIFERQECDWKRAITTLMDYIRDYPTPTL